MGRRQVAVEGVARRTLKPNRKSNAAPLSWPWLEGYGIGRSVWIWLRLRPLSVLFMPAAGSVSLSGPAT